MEKDLEESIDVSLDDCRRWSDEINEKLDDVRAKQGEDAYKLAFMTAFLLLWFANSVDEDPESDVNMKISKPSPKEMN